MCTTIKAMFGSIFGGVKINFKDVKLILSLEMILA